MRYVVFTMAGVALVATALVGASFADTIAVLNPSFEQGPLPPNYGTPTGWDGALVTESASAGLTSGTTGSYVGQLSTGDGAEAGAYQTLAQTFVAGTTYTWTTDVGMRNDKLTTAWYAQSVDWSMGLHSAGVATLARLSGTIVNDAAHTGFLTTETLQYVATAADAGKSIQFEFLASSVGKANMSGNPDDGGPNGFISFDNVQLTSSIATPEPGTVVLLGTGLFGLLAYARRKRK